MTSEKMLNQVAVEALYSATYVENYLDSVENLPDDLQRFLSRIRELDNQCRICLRDADIYYEQWSNCPTSELEAAGVRRSRAMARIQQNLIAAQELGDEKMALVTQLQELIDHKTRQLDHDYKNLDYGNDDMLHSQSGPGAGALGALDNSHHSMAKENIYGSVSSPVPNSPNYITQSNHFNSQLYMQMTTAPMSNLASGCGMGVQPSTFSSSTSSSNNGNTHFNSGERGPRRARRTRVDTGNGMEVGGSSDSNSLINDGQGTTSKGCLTLGPSGGGSGSGSGQGAGAKRGQQNSGKKKKRKTRLQGGSGNNNGASGISSNNNSSLHGRDKRDDTPPQDDIIDPDEPTYCICDQISFGEMILCDNDLCPIEWFHFSCVELVSKPKGKWYCPNCRGDRPNMMKPKQQFLRELERYNREREEKT